jgi:hypothetical protein
MDIYKDCRVISLNSSDASQLNNGSKYSDLQFNFKNLLIDSEDILYATIGVTNCQIPVSWYLIDSDTDTLNFIWNSVNYSITLDHGNYNASTFISQLTTKFQLISGIVCSIVLNKINGKLSFDFKGTVPPTMTFLSTGSQGIFRIIGFDVNTNYSGIVIVPDYPMNLLGIQKIKVCSNNLATVYNYDSSKSGTNVLQVIPIDVPSYNLITYTNKTGDYGKLKSRNVSIVDIQLLDEFGRFVQMNGINYCLTLQLNIFRKYLNQPKVLDIKPLELVLDRIENDLEVMQEQLPQNQDSTNLENSNSLDGQIPENSSFQSADYNPDQDLGLLLYQHGGTL